MMQKRKNKIYIICLLVLVFIVGAGSYFLLTKKESVYIFSEHQDGYTIEAEYFDTIVEQRYDLTEGDVIRVDVQRTAGAFTIVMGCEGKEPIYTGNGPLVDEFCVTVNEAGEYIISCQGNAAEGVVNILIERK